MLVGGSQAVEGEPGLMAMLPRFNAPARVLLRYNDAEGLRQDALTSVSPLCGFVVPSALDGSLEFFSATGLALGRAAPGLRARHSVGGRPGPARLSRPQAQREHREHVPRAVR